MGLEVIGAGFGRTGTNSLKSALEVLGSGPCHHMFEIRDNPELAPAWISLCNGAPADWDGMFSGYRAQVDWPGAAYWRELAEYYPDAKVILTLRDPQSWYESVQATIGPFMTTLLGQHSSDYMNELAEWCHELIVQRIFDGRLEDCDHAISVFNAHAEEVRESIPSERLLVYEVGSGWEPLCDFLGAPVPEIDFPNSNTTAAFRENVLSKKGGNSN